MSFLTIPSGSDIQIPWAEYISRGGWTETMSFGLDESSATVVHLINGSDLYKGDFTGWIPAVLGFPQLKNNAAISRNVPARHPLFSWMYATRILSVEGVQFAGKYNQSTPLAGYTFYKVTVLYRSQPYRILQDIAIEDDGGPWEWNRYCTYNTRSTVDILTSGSSYFKWGTGATSTGAYPLGVPQKVCKTLLQITWHQIPEWALLDPNTLAAVNLDFCVGTVNQALNAGVWGTTDFLGRRPGCLLMEPYQIVPHEAPLPPSLIWSGAPSGSAPRVYDVTFNLSHFDPPTGGSIYGHNLVPDPKDTNGYWWPLVGNNAGSPNLLNYTDFTEMFTSLV